ncbi:MAG: HEAT repeat domain-containing protein [Planctomycetes bacterium]|nr:HEAT repeat domain-containing protein [Planctomycetota bacterium]
MKRMSVFVTAALLLGLGWGCATPGRHAKPEARDAGLEATYAAGLDALLPGIGHPNLLERKESQLEFEQICFEASRPGAGADRAALCRVTLDRLGPETPLAARVWLLRQLERISGVESVEGLVELLNDAEPRVRELARRCLQNNPAPMAGGALRGALIQTEQAAWQVAIINALAARREQASVGILVEQLDGRDASVQRAALSALGDIGGPEATDALYAAWRNDASPLRDHAADVLVRYADRLLAVGKSRDAANIYEDVYLSSVARPIHVAALRGLAQAKRDKALPLLFELMNGEDEELCSYAARFALDIPGKKVTRALADGLASTPPTVQAQLLAGLAERDDVAARPVVLRALDSEDEAVRVAAIWALGRLGDAATVTTLASLAASAQEAEAVAARASLAKLRGKRVNAAILKAMKKSAAAERAVLVRALGARHAREALAALFNAATDADEAVRAAAFDVLADLARADDLPKLLDRLMTERGETAQMACEDAVVVVAGRVSEPEQPATPVLAKVPTASGSAKAALIRVLGRLGGRAALDAIRAARADTDAVVVDAAVRALAQWPDTAALEDLLDIAKNSTEQPHRVLAVWAYVRLVRLPSERGPAETLELLRTALGLAERVDEKKLVLSGVADVMHLDALRMAESFLADDSLRAEAAIATLTIARSLSASEPEASLAAVDKVAALEAGEAVMRQVDETRQFIERYRGYCVDWLVAGPYFEDGLASSKLFERDFPPETDGPVEWQPLTINTPTQPWRFNLAAVFGGQSRCAYAKTSIWAEAEQAARLEIGTDDGVKVWLNGEVVHANDTARGLTVAEDKVPITLRQGWNTLLLKITQGDGDWGFCCGVKAPDGGNLNDLLFATE